MQLSREELLVESSQVSQSFLSVGLHCRRDHGFLHSHLTETGAMLVSFARRKIPRSPQQAVLSRIPLFRDCFGGKVDI